ncbi:BhlA/UviB family holin-like peptide [Bacillus andreraoultii]|uniref:BhlA/UviB family holin-like peptide n=1 Tax=Bacillus andreraoultii TaxID=1499685 RepID=UPI00053A5542|nr:BhlA/UviB family holin-like peptide [Bacillus andreraoultii]
MDVFASQSLLAEAAKQGLWAVLYITLFIYTLKESRRQENNAKEREDRLREEYNELRKESRERENMLTTFINDITRAYERLATAVERLSYDVDDIKDELKLRKEDKGGEEK